MSNPDSLEDLNRLFINHGAAVKPGDSLEWRDYQVKTEQNVGLTNLVRENIDEVNKEMENSSYSSPFCNPIILIFSDLEFIVNYFAGEFEVQTKDKPFRETFAGIWYEFIRGWYFGTIYVGYGEDFEEIDKQKFIKDGKNFYLDGIPGKFRLYTKGQKGTFHSVLSGQTGLTFTPEQERRIIRCESKGYMRWLDWWRIWLEWEEGMQRFSASVEDLSKNVVLTPKTEQEHKSIVKQFKNWRCFIKRDGNQIFGGDSTPQMGKTKFEEVIFMPRETPMAIFEGISKKFEARAARMGYAPAIPQQKKERINSGENFPHQKLVANITTSLLRELNYFFDRMRFAFPEGAVPFDIKIIRANQAEAQGLPHMQFGGTFNKFDKPFDRFNNRFDKFNKQDDMQGND